MKEGGFRYRLNYTLINKGSIYAKYINYFIYLPQKLVEDNSSLIKDGNAIFYGENKSDKMGYKPLLPHMKDETRCIRLKIEGDTVDDNLFVEYEIHADNSDVKRGRVRLSEIPCNKVEGWKDEDIKFP